VTEPRLSKIKSSLARKMAAPGGRTVAEAVSCAEAGLESHREEGMRALAITLAQLETVCALREPGSEPKVYERAAALLDMAGFFETGPLYAAAFSLCEVSDRMLAAGTWDWPSAAVHVRALRLILTDGCQDDESSRVILEGLATVARRWTR
jgi:hypothetical protein